MVDFEIIYIIEKINGDYAYCRSESGSCTNIALALLPDDIDEGDRIRFCKNKTIVAI